MTNFKSERRLFLERAAGVAATVVAGSVLATRAWAGEQGGHEGHSGLLGTGAVDGYEMSSGVDGRCATCEFWGGQRRRSESGATITVTGLGWCNNPKSPDYRKMTSPEHGPDGGSVEKVGGAGLIGRQRRKP